MTLGELRLKHGGAIVAATIKVPRGTLIGLRLLAPLVPTVLQQLALGVSGKTYEKAKRVVEAAEDDPEEFGDLPGR